MAFLFGKKVRGFSIVHPLGKSVELPPALKPEDTQPLAKKLMSGTITNDERMRLYDGHIRLAIHVAGKYAKLMPKRKDDLVGEALLAIGVAIEKGKERLRDDKSFAPYLIYRIHRALQKFLDELFDVKVPTGSVEWLKKNNVPSIKIVSIFELEEDTTGKAHRKLKQRRIIGFNPRKSHLADLKELIEKSIKTEKEKEIIDLREQGYTDSDIAIRLEISRAQVQLLRTRVAQRFEQLESGD